MVSELPQVPQLQPEGTGHSIREVGRDLVRSMALSPDGITGWTDCASCKQFVGQTEIIRGIRITADTNDLTYEEVRGRAMRAHHYSHTKGQVED